MFNTEQRRFFKRNGYLVLEEELSSETVGRAREALWEALNVNPESVQDAETRYTLVNESDISDLEPFQQIHDVVFGYANELVGGDVLKDPKETFGIPEDMTLPINLPDGTRLSETHLRSNNNAHVDGFGEPFKDPETYETYIYYTINAAIYFNDVIPGGGGFTVYPGSHHIAATYFEEHSLPSPGWTGYLPAIDDRGGWDYNRRLGHQLRDVEIVGPPGTVILYHNKLLHKAGFNQRDRARMAGITRYTHEQGDEIAQDAATNLWRYWPGMQEIELDLESNPITQTDGRTKPYK